MGGGNVSQDQTSIICIDLKSFYASVECVERGLNPFKTNLVVADPTRSKSTICLAITPAMKSLGIKNRCRIHEIPDCVKYITAMPRMQLYMDYSAKIYGIYLRYVSKEDIHVYSVDECFIDVTNYLQLYHLTAKEMAVKLMQEVMEETGITATAGVGTNLYLAKIAMDIVAKHVDDHIGILDEFSYREQLWDHKPLSDFWRIGSRTEKKLAGYGIHTMGDIAMASLRSEDWLYKMFGIDAELLIDHAWGYETCRMSDIKNYHSEEHSLSNGQVLMRNYSFEEALVIVREMTDNLALDLFEKGLVTSSLTLWIAYDHRYEHEASKGTVKLERESNSSKKIIDAVEDLYRRIADKYTGIRRIEVCANRVAPENYVQYSLFDDPKQTDKERHLQEAVLMSRWYLTAFTTKLFCHSKSFTTPLILRLTIPAGKVMTWASEAKAFSKSTAASLAKAPCLLTGKKMLLRFLRFISKSFTGNFSFLYIFPKKEIRMIPSGPPKA